MSEFILEEVKQKFQSLSQRAQPSAAAAGLISGAETTQSGVGNDHTPTGNAKFKAMIAKERLLHLEGRYDKFYDDLKQSQERMAELSVRIARLDFTTINHEEIIDLLNKALAILGELQKQWGKLVNFFGQIQALVQVTVKETLIPFVEQASSQLDTKKLTVEDRNIVLDLLKEQTIAIHRSTYMVFIMARTYVDMSDKYLMNQIAGLSKMLAATTDTQRNQLKSQLFQTSTTLAEEVGKMALERKQQYHERINNRLSEVNDFLKNLGGVTAEDEKMAKEGAKLAGMVDEDGDDVYLVSGIKLPGLDK
ncbi:unnamed protein product [Didymodactylos carnosus]|uniref:Uncharacterized protein n=1 Tax=Didymodactylos carnosus TaxID=1234261 RepID=A0A813Y5N7_9BILA|nr:unnamed protein product [Didymodactylos carnosus]CAF1139404.1 unnamed protein product [Didymodactylos carnosus]CAF3665812.1 unnamed protein product [Didymodactylos carnosus]CAF3932375.1 unnamed protein product [Didymodactylos carnosus]